MFKDKIAIVTGAGKGIGRGIALALAKGGCGIVLSDIDMESLEKVAKEIEDLGQKAMVIKCDVSNKSEVENMVSETVGIFGKLDILVNNAGIFPFKSFLELGEKDWDQVINVNLKSVFLCSQAAAKNMKDGGKIVNISSIASFVGFEGLTHYCASKAGINGLTRAMALELAGKKINVNAIAPGAINTPGANKEATDESIKQTIAAIPWGRMGEPEDIANTVLFLASEQSDYITGQVIAVDGGWTVR